MKEEQIDSEKVKSRRKLQQLAEKMLEKIQLKIHTWKCLTAPHKPLQV